MEVIQRSSLSVQLPDESELFSIFVNGKAFTRYVRVREMLGIHHPSGPGRSNSPGAIYLLVDRKQFETIEFGKPQLNVPLENIQWNVIAQWLSTGC